MSAREDVLGAVRRSLGVSGREAPRREAVAARLRDHAAGPIPARGRLPEAERLDLFARMAAKAAATVERVASLEAVPAAVAAFLREANLPATLRRGDDPALSAMDWAATALDVSTGPSDGGDLNGVSMAFGAVAETGTVVLLSGPDNPTSLNFLPDNHVVVVDAARVAGDLEAVLARLPRAPGALPRSVNLVTGPSRSADIEQTLILGAHGPRRLHVIVAGG